MPRTVHRLRAFLASPGDIKEERERLERIVTELNRTWTDSLGIEIELVRWETHAYPGFSTDPQATINEEIHDDYEIFIGLLWTRVGTPTPRAASGTLEEFEKAYSQFKVNSESVSLLIYFKEQPVSPAEIDGDQIGQIQKFRKSLGDLGGLYWTFQTCGDFEALVRPHLARVIQIWKERIERSVPFDQVSDHVRSAGGQDEPVLLHLDTGSELDDLGYLDYMELGQQANSVMIETLDRMTSAMSEFGAQIEELTAGSVSSSDLKAARELAEKTAHSLEIFAQRISAELPVFADAYSDVLKAFSGAASISVEATDGKQRVESALKEVKDLRASLESGREGLATFTRSLRSTPRMTTRLIRAAQKGLRAMATADDEFAKARANSIMVEASISDLLERSPGKHIQ